jgi:hypothetical protein
MESVPDAFFINNSLWIRYRQRILTILPMDKRVNILTCVVVPLHFGVYSNPRLHIADLLGRIRILEA